MNDKSPSLADDEGLTVAYMHGYSKGKEAAWVLFGAQAKELSTAIKADGCCHHWKEVVQLLDQIASQGAQQ